MNKNTLIAVLIIVLVIGIGAYVVKNNAQQPTLVTDTPNTTNTDTPVTTQEAPAEANIPGAPIVATSKATTTFNATASLSGAVKPNGASTSYWFEYGESTAFGNRSTSQSIGSGYYLTPTPAFITGLKPSTLYYFRLNAQNKFSTTHGEVYTFTTNTATPPKVVMASVRTNKATGVARTTATINGEVNPNGVATNYWFEYGTDTNFGYVTQFEGTNSGSSYMSISGSLSNLMPVTKYYFRLNAQNQFGTVLGSTQNFTTTGPASFTKPTVQTSQAKNVSSTDATFTGSINPNGSSTTYWFEYSTDSLLGSLIGSGTPQGIVTGTTSQQVQINVNGLAKNTKYYYHLVATNEQGETSGSIVSFTTRK